MEQPLLEKYECINKKYGGSFLTNIKKTKGRDLIYPFCGSNAGVEGSGSVQG